MNSPSCHTLAPTSALMAYWLGELDPATEAALEEHLFGCEPCTARLRRLAQLAEGIRRATLDGTLHAIVTTRFVSRLQEAGFNVREYRMQPGGSVMCTVAPEDDFVVAHLQVPLSGVAQLDIVYHDVTAGTCERLEDVAFDAGTDEVVLIPNVAQLRKLTSATQRAELVAVEPGSERVIGVYTFNHRAHGRAE